MNRLNGLNAFLLMTCLLFPLLFSHGGSHKEGTNQVAKASSKAVDTSTTETRTGNGVSEDADFLVKKELDLVRIDEKVGDTLDLDLAFFDHKGNKVILRDLVKDRPVLLSFVYYSCPFFCQYVLQAEERVIKQMGLAVGKDYDVVTISFDKNDDLEQAQKKHEQYALPLDTLDAGNGDRHKQSDSWYFLYGDASAINHITKQVGFYFKWIEENKEFAHTAAIYILSPEGKISRYFYGIDYNPFDVKLAIYDAKEEKSRSTTERVMLYCYRYDSASRGYALQAKNIMKVGGVTTVIFISGMIGALIRRERKLVKIKQDN